MNVLRELFPSNDFMPHGFCYQWNPLLIWLHAVSDILIAVSYFCIPFALIYMVRKKRSIPFNWMIVCFGIFIAACGATHFMEVVTLWIPAYWISGGVKAVTALASLPTAILLARVMPKILELPTSEDLRAANRELSKREAILRDQASLLDLSQDAILVQTMEGKNLLWNQGAERMYGWTKAEATGRINHDLLQTTFPIPREEILSKLAASGYWEGELQQKRRDGTTILVSSRWALRKDGQGSSGKILMIATDITEHRCAEEALRRSEERFRLMADNIGEIFWLLDPQSLGVLYVSPAFEHICERSLASIYANPTSYREIIHPDDVQHVLEKLALLEKTNHFHEQFRIVCPAGKVKWVEVRGFTARDSAGKVTALVGTAQDITKRKSAEDSRHQSEELLRAAVEEAAVGFAMTDVHGYFMKVNKAYCRITGYSEEELLQRDFRSITHEEDLPVNLALREALLAGESSSGLYQKRYRRKSGELVWAQNSASVLRAGDGTISGFVVLTTDITDRKRAEDALRESEDRYRDLVEHSQDLICTHDLHGRLLSVNQLPTRILGYTKEELLGKPMREFLLEEAKPHFDEYLTRIKNEGSAHGILVVLTKSGKQRLWEYSNTLRTEGVSEPVVRGIAHDVTEQKLAERALRLSEEKFAKAFQASPYAIIISTIEEGRLIDVNDSFVRIMGFSREEVIGRTSFELSLWTNPADRIELIKELDETGRVNSRQIIFQTRDARPLVVNLSSETIVVGGRKCLMSVCEDITERRRAEERLRNLSGRLLQLQDEERRKLARDLHDATGQDLVALSGTLGHLRETIPTSSRKVRKSVSQCQALADRCIREIRTLSYLLHPPLLDEVGLEDAIRHYVPGYEERTGIEVELEVTLIGRLSREEEMALFRVMQESLVNIHRHSGSFRAKISLERNGHGVVLQISDSGRGIPDVGEGRISGFCFAGGVGIQSMQERMKQIHGQLDIKSCVQGTTVRATVPRHE